MGRDNIQRMAAAVFQRSWAASEYASRHDEIIAIHRQIPASSHAGTRSSIPRVVLVDRFAIPGLL